MSSSGELVVEDSRVSALCLRSRSLSKPPPMPRSSGSSSSSTRFSLMMLLLVMSLAIEPARLRGCNRSRQEGSIEAVEAKEEAEALRATTRSSMALSRARASCMTTASCSECGRMRCKD